MFLGVLFSQTCTRVAEVFHLEKWDERWAVSPTWLRGAEDEEVEKWAGSWLWQRRSRPPKHKDSSRGTTGIPARSAFWDTHTHTHAVNGTEQLTVQVWFSGLYLLQQPLVPHVLFPWHHVEFGDHGMSSWERRDVGAGSPGIECECEERVLPFRHREVLVSAAVSGQFLNLWRFDFYKNSTFTGYEVCTVSELKCCSLIQTWVTGWVLS